MATTTRAKVPGWAMPGDTAEHWEKTPIWDEEFAARWDALQADLEDEPAPAVKPRTPRKPRQKTPTRR